MRKLVSLLCVCLLTGSLFFACGLDGDGQIPADYGRVTFMLKSDGGNSGIAEEVAEAWVKIDQVSVHAAGGGGWSLVSEDVTLVDLLRLPDYAADLGIADLPAGKITQVRLHVAEDSDSYVVLDDDSTVPMVVPSGDKSGIKVKGNWDIGECTENVLGLTISSHHNAIHVHPNGHGDLYIFRPVIKADELITEEGECDDPDNDSDDPEDQDFDDCIPGDDTNDCPDDGDGTDPDDGDDDPDDDSDDNDDSNNDDPPDDGDDPPDDGEDPPDDGDDPPDDGEDPPDDGDDPPDDDDCDPSLDDTCP